MALYSSTEGYEYFNLFGNSNIGRVDVGSRDVVWVDPESGVAETSKVRVDSRCYYVQDHLGSNRVTIDTTGTVLNAQDYYAFGEILRSYNNSSPNERYYFTGKERDTETNLDYFGARYYDSELGRWLNVDPLADKYPEWSGYNYCMNNPVNVIDPDGMDTTQASQNSSSGTSSYPVIDPVSTTQSIGTQLLNGVMNGLIDGGLEAVDQGAQFVAGGTLIAAGVATATAIVFPPAATAVPVLLKASTGADAVSASAKYAKAARGTGTLEDAHKKAAETAVGAGIGKVIDKVASQVVIRTGLKTEFRSPASGRYVTNVFGRTVTNISNGLNVASGPVSSAVLRTGSKSVTNFSQRSQIIPCHGK